MVVTCEHVWREVSNYLEGEIDPGLRQAIEEHLKGCKRCTAVFDGTRNIIKLYGDERVFELPVGFSRRLQSRLADSMPRPRGLLFGWLVAATALALISGSAAVATAYSRKASLRSEHARSVNDIPPDLMVEVSEDGKTFHVPGCRFIHSHPDKVRLVAARLAMQEGYVPCVRCLRRYLGRDARSGLFRPGEQLDNYPAERQSVPASGQ
jgi:hypothetical protein